MSIAELKPTGGAVVSGPRAEILAGVADPATTLAIWRRHLSDPLRDAADKISERALDYVTSFDPFCEREQRRAKQELAGVTGGDGARLHDDLLDLSRRYAQASRSRKVKIRLETVRDDGCRRFHLDNVVMRLVVAYRGPGTQWVSPAFAAAARDQQTAYEGPLNCLNTGDVALFRGKKSGAPDLIYHRSPPLPQGAPARLVGVIDS